MSKYYHEPLSRKDEASILIFNQRFSQLDSAIVSFVSQTSDRLTVTAGENIADRDAVYLDLSDNKIYRIDADAAGPLIGRIRGFADGAALADASATLVLAGILDGFSGLSAWMPIYAGIAAGSISQTRPEPYPGSSQIMLAEMGFAVAADTIYIEPKPIEYKIRDAMAQNDTLTLLHHADTFAYQRKLLAYITEITLGSSLTSYTSGNQDSDVYLQLDGTSGGTLTITASGANGPIGDNVGIEFKCGQSFTIVDVGVLDEITVRLGANVGSPTGDITWSIEEDNISNPGRPSGVSLASSTFTPTPSATNTISVTGVNRIFLLGQLYWLVLSVAAQPNTTRYQWQGAQPSVYAGGEQMSYSSATGSWSANNMDCQMSIKTATFPTKERLEQGFQIGSPANIGRVDLYLKRIGSPTGYLSAKIYSNSGGNPNTLLGTSDVVAASSLATSYGLISFAFASPVAASAATQYHLVLETSDAASTSDYVAWGADGSSPSYANGEMKYYDGASWSAESKDAVFDVRTADTFFPERVKQDCWDGTHGDMVSRYGDTAGDDANTKTSFKCMRVAGFADVTLSVVLD